MFSLSFFSFHFFFTSTVQNTISKQINKKITNNSPKIIQNLQGTPSASRNSVQQDFWARDQCWNNGGALLHAPPSLVARGFTRHRWNSKTTGGQSRLPLFFPSPAVRITVTCKRRKTHKAVGFNFFLLVFGSVSLFLHLGRSVRFFFFPNLLYFRWLPASSPLFRVVDRATVSRWLWAWRFLWSAG